MKRPVKKPQTILTLMPTLITEIALQVRSDLLEAYYSDLEVRENITALEVNKLKQRSRRCVVTIFCMQGSAVSKLSR